MKKKLLSSFLFAGLLALSISACNKNTGPDYSGDERYRIYQLAQEAGYSGTYEEWLASIKGKDGIDGKNGEDGHSPVITIESDGYWYIDGVNTGVKAEGQDGQNGKDGKDGQNGKDGKDGTDGQDGQNGIDGQPGKDGNTIFSGNGIPDSETGKNGDAYIDLKTWDYFVKENGEWIKKGNIQGEQGEKGSDGVSVLKIELDSSDGNVDTYKITYSDGNTSYFTVTNGQDGQSIKGDPGKDGHTPVITISSDGYWVVDGEKTDVLAQGPKGETGVSVIKTEINEDGDLIITFSDGTTTNAGHVKNVDKHIVKFFVDDDLVATKEVKHGEKVSKPTEQETAGYTVSDWYYLDGSTHESWKFFGYVITEDVNLHAVFEYNNYTISLVDNVHGKVFSDISVTYDKPFTLPTAAVTGYRIKQWKDSDGSIWNDGTYRFAGNITLYAVWQAKTITLSLINENGEGVGDGVTVEYGSEYELPELSYAPDGLYFDCWKLNGVEIPLTGTWTYCDEDDILVAYYRLHESIETTLTSNGYLITGCSNKDIKSLVIPSSLHGKPIIAIETEAFLDCHLLESVVLADTITSIGCGAFAKCYSLKSINITNNVSSVGDYAFQLCSSLSSVTIGTGTSSIGDGAFSGCTSLASITIPSNVTQLGSQIFADCSSLSKVTILGNITSISRLAFYGCSSLMSINIPNTVTLIDHCAFADCTSLSSVEIPNSVRYLGSRAFENCTSLTSIVIPDSVAFLTSEGTDTIGYVGGTFSGCTSLASVTISNQLTLIAPYMFSGCKKLSSITIPDSVRVIDNNAFEECTALASINIPDDVTDIQEYAFNKCFLLKSIVIPATVTKMGSNVFSGCYSLKVYCAAESKPDGWKSDWNPDNCDVSWGWTGSNV